MNKDKNNTPEPGPKNANREAEEIFQEKPSNSPSTGGGRGEALEASSPVIKDDEIDLIALVKTIWAGRKIIIYSVVVCAFIGLVYAFASPAKYKASATLLPSAEKKGSNLGGLGALAGMAGINLGSMMGESSGIPAEIYPQVVKSYPFLNEFIHQKFNFEKYPQPISIYDYVLADTIASVGSTIKKYTIRLPWTLKNAITANDEITKDTIRKDYGVLHITKVETRALESVQNIFKIEVDKKTDLVDISVEVKEPLLAAQYVQKGITLLQQYIINYKTQQARENLDFVQQRFNEKKKEYEEAHTAFFDYKDNHRNIVSERINLEYQSLNDNYDIASTVYKGLSQQLEQAKIAVKEETPVFTVLEPVRVPIEKSTPKKAIILLVSGFLGGFIGIAWIFGKLIWNNVKEKF